ncbi:MAG: response regulator [Gemmatales bacterium]|nr:response regulator [Gemmatales bacterium]MDW7994348.1 response regulator [Gemmatales bacterium]
MSETILIVEDEDSVRRTLYEWLRDAHLGCELLQASDAESALRIANERPIDLALLDWHLGAGLNGLQLLQDLQVFSPDVVAILITAYAQQATPLDALRMGVRDYLDKDRDLRREILVGTVRRQLEQIRPAKRQREHLQRVQAFRQTIETILPIVQTSAELASPVPVSETLRALLQLAQTIFHTRQGVLIIHSPHRAPAQTATQGTSAHLPHQVSAESIEREVHAPCTVLDLQAQPLAGPQSFADTLAAATLALREACTIANLDEAEQRFGVRLEDYERGHSNLLALPLTLENDQAAVLELFDTPWAVKPLEEHQRSLLRYFQQLASAVLTEVFATRQLHTALLSALQAALQASHETPGPEMLNKPEWKMLLTQTDLLPREPEEVLQLAAQLHALHRKYGPAALRFCQRILEQLEHFLRELLGPGTSAV